MFFWLFLGLLVLACLLAILVGGGPERLVALLFLTAWLASMAVERPFSVRYATLETATMVVDLLLFVALLWIALTSRRYWPMALVSLQAIILIVHLVKLLDPLLIRAAYERMTIVWPMLQVLILIGGTLVHARTRKTTTS
jgi:hypothetical protein